MVQAPQRPLKVAVIGSGMAGLAAGWLCHRAGHRVVLYEAQARRGMDAHTLRIPTARGEGLVDVPLRVMSPHAWPSVLALCAELGVETFATDTFASFSWLRGETWLRNGGLRLGKRVVPFLASGRSVNRSSAEVGLGLLLWRLRPPTEGESLGEWATRAALPQVFLRGFLLPLLTTICTCDEATLLAWPAAQLMSLFGRILLGKTLRRLTGGTPALVDGLVKGLEVRAPERVVAVTERADALRVATASGHEDTFDRVLVATQANQVAGFLGDTFASERAVLERFRYDSGELVTHRDARFMPRRREDWTPLSYLIERDLSRQMFTVWVNPVEPSLRGEAAVFQTWNPLFAPSEEAVVARVKLQRAVVDAATTAAHRELEGLHAEPGRRLFFCGSYAAPGVPLLESAVRSAMGIAWRLGAPAPWAPHGRPANA